MEANNKDLKKLIHALSPDVERELRNTWTSLLKGAVVTGGCTLVCGALIGPVGFAVGGAIGGLCSWLTSKKFKSVPEILKEMTDDQRRDLFNAIRRHLQERGVTWENAEQLIAAVMGNYDLKRTIINLSELNVWAEVK
uniref:Uncharacterized protein n=1 Tax=Oreochromis aureus TaxID=47969 RepID=A0A668V0G6_OREAU